MSNKNTSNRKERLSKLVNNLITDSTDEYSNLTFWLSKNHPKILDEYGNDREDIDFLIYT